MCCRFPVVFALLAIPVATRAQAPDGALAKAKQVLAKIDGDVTLAGLREPVEVLRDRWGIAHIYAKNQHDLFFAQGFVAAQDRLFQIDIWRRQATGEMAEAFGPDYVAADRFARLMKYRGDMDAEWASYSPDTKEIATAFTEGINACIDHFADKLPIEFQLRDFKPKKWKPEDVLGRMSGIYMSQNFRNELLRAQLIAAVGIDKARWLAPVDPPRDYVSPLPVEELKAIDKRILADYDAATKALSYKPSKTESNNWVVSGERSVSGKPLLASDPHRALALPSLRYLVHLNAPGWNVIGAGEPGLPGVAIGHNDRIAWGFTIIGVDQADFFVEETNPKQIDEYRVGDKWVGMKVIHDTIAVKGEALRPIQLKYTRYGPVLFHDTASHRAYALKWAGSEPGGAAYLGSLAVSRAKDQSSFLASLKSWKVPGLNFVYADIEGNFGWIAAAAIPVRPKHDGLLPVPGNAGFDWSGYLPVSEYPQSFNPISGWLATANHNILYEGYKHPIGYEFAPPYRFQRIRDVIVARDKFDLDDFKKLQHDDRSLPGLALIDMLKETEIKESKLTPFKTMLTKWDGRLDVNSYPAVLFELWLRELQTAFHAPHMPNEMKASFATLSGLPVMIDALQRADVRWLGNDAKTARAALFNSTLETAVRKLEALPQKRWGDLHRAAFKHPLSPAFSLDPVERSGDANTPNNTRFDDKFNQVHGATYRHVIDLADWDKAQATSAPGQSGQPGSRHYADLLPLWGKGEYFPLAFSRKKVEEVTAHRLTLIAK